MALNLRACGLWTFILKVGLHSVMLLIKLEHKFPVLWGFSPWRHRGLGGGKRSWGMTDREGLRGSAPRRGSYTPSGSQVGCILGSPGPPLPQVNSRLVREEGEKCSRPQALGGQTSLMHGGGTVLGVRLMGLSGDQSSSFINKPMWAVSSSSQKLG